MADKVDTLKLKGKGPEVPIYKGSTPENIPILPVRETVVFPNLMMPLAVTEQSAQLIKDAMGHGYMIIHPAMASTGV